MRVLLIAACLATAAGKHISKTPQRADQEGSLLESALASISSWLPTEDNLDAGGDSTEDVAKPRKQQGRAHPRTVEAKRKQGQAAAHANAVRMMKKGAAHHAHVGKGSRRRLGPVPRTSAVHQGRHRPAEMEEESEEEEKPDTGPSTANGPAQTRNFTNGKGNCGESACASRVPSSVWLGYGYNLVTGNPNGDLNTGIDPGFTIPVLNVSWNEGVASGFTAPEYACTQSKTAKIIATMADYQSDLSVDVSTSMSANAKFGAFASAEVAASASASYSKFKKDVVKNNRELVSRKSYCMTFWLGYMEGAKMKPGRYFKRRVKQLGTLDTSKCSDTPGQCVDVVHEGKFLHADAEGIIKLTNAASVHTKWILSTEGAIRHVETGNMLIVTWEFKAGGDEAEKQEPVGSLAMSASAVHRQDQRWHYKDGHIMTIPARQIKQKYLIEGLADGSVGLVSAGSATADSSGGWNITESATAKLTADWYSFFDEFGTHVIETVHLGGKMTQTITRTKKEQQSTSNQKAKTEVSGSVGTSALFVQAKIEASVAAGYKWDSDSSNNKDFSDEKTVVVGGVPSKEDFASWATSCKANPMPVKYTIAPLTELPGGMDVHTYQLMFKSYGKMKADMAWIQQNTDHMATMYPGDEMIEGGSLTDPATGVSMTLQRNGLLVLHDAVNTLLWSSEIPNEGGQPRAFQPGPYKLVLLRDNNLVVQGISGKRIWESNTDRGSEPGAAGEALSRAGNIEKSAGGNKTVTGVEVFTIGGRCADDPAFTDEQDWDCSGWEDYDCKTAVSGYSYSKTGQAKLLASCPVTCKNCGGVGAAVVGDKIYELVREKMTTRSGKDEKVGKFDTAAECAIACQEKSAMFTTSSRCTSSCECSCVMLGRRDANGYKLMRNEDTDTYRLLQGKFVSPNCTDDPHFKGYIDGAARSRSQFYYTCSDWEGYNCTTAAIDYSYVTQEGQAELLFSCPVACKTCPDIVSDKAGSMGKAGPANAPLPRTPKVLGRSRRSDAPAKLVIVDSEVRLMQGKEMLWATESQGGAPADEMYQGTGANFLLGQCVTLYEASDQGSSGKSHAFGPGDFLSHDLIQHFGVDLEIKSFMIQDGCKLRMYAQDDLLAPTGSWAKVSNGGVWKNNIQAPFKSMKIRMTDPVGAAKYVVQ